MRLLDPFKNTSGGEDEILIAEPEITIYIFLMPRMFPQYVHKLVIHDKPVHSEGISMSKPTVCFISNYFLEKINVKCAHV